MKKKYESPLAEKYDFNYVENVVASEITGLQPDAIEPGNIVPTPPIGNPKKGKDNPGCYKGNSTGERSCVQYD